MSIKIHHGPDGTFKTSGAIKDDILGVIKSGRTLVTNIRGFSREQTVAILGDKHVHADFTVIHVDTDCEQGREKLRRFFHWAPKGAFFVIDEVQRIWPPKLTEKQLAEYNYPENQEHLPEDQRRPETIHVAWDMQRHHNWDFIFTTTNIKKVHEMARVMAKVAVRHVNMGIWRFYKTVEHDPDSNGRTASQITTTRLFNYVPKHIFGLYASTTTGSFENTEPRTPFYKDIKILSLLFFLVALWGYILSKPAPKALSSDGKENAESASTSTQKTSGEKRSEVSTEEDNSKTPRIPDSDKKHHLPNRVYHVDQVSTAFLAQFTRYFISGVSINNGTTDIVFNAYIGKTEFTFNSDDLIQVGISPTLKTECLVELRYNNQTEYVFCEPRKVQPIQIEKDFQPPKIG